MMVVGNDDLGLTLSLACTTTTTTTNNNMGKSMHETVSQQLNLMTTTTTTPLFLQKLPWNRSTDSFPISDRNSDSTVSTVSGKRSSGERDCEEIEVERASSRGGVSDDEDGGENSKKKLRLTKDQSATLEDTFKEHSTLNPKQKQALAKRLGLRPRQVEVWFQNRRARTKLKQTEVDCEFLKRCCEKLTEENRRLQKELLELRTLKMSPQMYMHMTPPTTLTMCPSCERVAGPPSSSTSASVSGRVGSSQRPMPINMWAGSPVQIRPIDSLHPRS